MKINVADKWFSRYIRLRDAWESNGVLVNKCATSDKLKVLPCKELECGHYMSRRHMNTRYSPLNAMPQCTYENRWKHGNPENMARALDKKFGEGTAERVRLLSTKPAKVDIKLTAGYYRELVNNMIKENGWELYKWW